MHGKKNSDYLVIEVGLGGRLDTTNIVDPVLSIITPVSFDHTNILGKNLKDIAFEKSGIIKKNKNVVISKQKKIVKDILLQKSLKCNSKLYEVIDCCKLISYKPSADGIYFDFKFNDTVINNFFISLLGAHQIDNFFISLLSVYLLEKSVIDVVVKDKIINIKLFGRVQVLQKELPIVIDVSHNKDSAKKLKEALKAHFSDIKKWIILSSMSSNKDYKGFYKELKEISKVIIITSQNNYKESNPEKVFAIAKKIFNNTIFIKDQDEAYKKAMSYNSPLLITGSFYLAGPILEKWNKNLKGTAL